MPKNSGGQRMMTGKQPAQARSTAPDVARLQRRILSSATQIGAREASGLLGLSVASPDAALTRMWNRGEILGFVVDGRQVYPLFQFDADGCRIVPGVSAVINAKPPGWSDYRLLHWLTTPHVDLGRTPAEALAVDGDTVMAAFQREIEPLRHG